MNSSIHTRISLIFLIHIHVHIGHNFIDITVHVMDILMHDSAQTVDITADARMSWKQQYIPAMMHNSNTGIHLFSMISSGQRTSTLNDPAISHGMKTCLDKNNKYNFMTFHYITAIKMCFVCHIQCQINSHALCRSVN